MDERDAKRRKASGAETKVSDVKKGSFLPCEAQIPFCPKCKNLIMVRVNGIGHCSNCKFQCPGDDLVRKETVATSERGVPQRWLESAEEKKNLFLSSRKKAEEERRQKTTDRRQKNDRRTQY